MAGMGTKLLLFLVVGHLLLYFVGSAQYGLIGGAGGSDPHKSFIDEFFDIEAESPSADYTGSVNVSTTTSGIKEDSWGAWGMVSGFVSMTLGILTSPYSIVANINIPLIFKVLIGSIFAVLEVIVVASFVWKKDF